MEKGYVQIYTGSGKGKTTAALGLIMRAVGAGWKVYFCQFIKDMKYNEISILAERFPEVTVEMFGSGKGCLLGREKESSDYGCAARGLKRAREALTSGLYDLVVLDEINIALDLGLLSVNDVLSLIGSRPSHVELVLTGRNAPKEIIQAADLVTEMQEIKHYYQKGVLARNGIER